MSGVIIRPLCAADVDAFPAGFAAQGWQKGREQYARYLKAQEAGEFQVLVAELDGEAAGYLLLKPRAPAGPFVGKEIAEIVDFNVLKKFQQRGLGNALMDEAERRAGGRTCLGVGLHSGYGTAQRMYVKRGYIPDGSGLWHGARQLAEGEPCINDDDLILYMAKGL